MKWDTYFLRFDPSSPSNDYVATYDHSTKAFTKLTISGFTDPRGLRLHGMDVVPSASSPNELWVYLVNHRPHTGDKAGKDAEFGADEAIEVFKTTVGSTVLTHVHTFEDPTASVIITPNDIAGSDDGQSLYFTNDHGLRTGKWHRMARAWFSTKVTSVGYCNVKTGCKIAVAGLPGTNGLVKTQDGTIWVASTSDGYIRGFSQQADNSLALVEKVYVGRLMDNLTVDTNGNIYAAVVVGSPLEADTFFADPIHNRMRSAAYNISLNTGRDAYFGEKWKVEKIFEDDGQLMSGVTTAFYDPKAKLMYYSGAFAPWSLVCPVV
ncbi:calcium-dependent phosphotriesterase [Clavulina sp. PMI_390]|nr:calcium-dependent phosphotriesterase [Clavulina sp. PMI_390]